MFMLPEEVGVIEHGGEGEGDGELEPQALL